MPLFGTNDIIYVPPGEKLVIDDVYRWRRVKIDLDRLSLRIQTSGFETIADRLRAAMELADNKPNGDGIRKKGELWLRELSGITGAGSGEEPASLREDFRNETAAWWVRITDQPAESFHEDDYERPFARHTSAGSYPTYGSVSLAAIDDLEFELIEEEGSPLAIEVADRSAIERFTMPPKEPLALVREFCGARGVSAFGRTVNLTAKGTIAEGHQFCSPMARTGSGLFLTLYFYFGTPSPVGVIAKLKKTQILRVIELLEKSRFETVSKGPTWCIYEREGDVVHLYDELEGKETEGAATIPPIMLVASAAGQYDPMHRAELLEAILGTMRSQTGA